jgi:NAD-dependent DNA ligase
MKECKHGVASIMVDAEKRCPLCVIADLQDRVRRLWVESLRDRIRFHAHLYYNLDHNLISDGQYDEMLKNLQKIERDHPELVTPDSPTQLVGESISHPLRGVR